MGATLGHRMVGSVFVPGWFFPHTVEVRERSGLRDSSNASAPLFSVARYTVLKCNVMEPTTRMIEDFSKADEVVTHVVATKTDVSLTTVGDRIMYDDTERGKRRWFEVTGMRDMMNQQRVFLIGCIELRNEETDL